MTKDDETVLNDLFAELRSADVPVRDALLDRIMLDADQVLADAAPAALAPPQARPGFGAILLDVIGGWPSFSGLAAATVAGLWIGVAPPDVISNLSASFWGDTIEVPLLENDLFTGLEG